MPKKAAPAAQQTAKIQRTALKLVQMYDRRELGRVEKRRLSQRFFAGKTTKERKIIQRVWSKFANRKRRHKEAEGRLKVVFHYQHDWQHITVRDPTHRRIMEDVRAFYDKHRETPSIEWLANSTGHSEEEVIRFVNKRYGDAFVRTDRAAYSGRQRARPIRSDKIDR